MRLFHPPILQAFIEWAHAFKLFQNLVVTCQARKIVCVRTYAQGALWRWVVKHHSHWAEAPPIRFAFSMRGYATKYYLTQESRRAMQCVECCCYWWKALEKKKTLRETFFLVSRLPCGILQKLLVKANGVTCLICGDLKLFAAWTYRIFINRAQLQFVKFSKNWKLL